MGSATTTTAVIISTAAGVCFVSVRPCNTPSRRSRIRNTSMLRNQSQLISSPPTPSICKSWSSSAKLTGPTPCKWSKWRRRSPVVKQLQPVWAQWLRELTQIVYVFTTSRDSKKPARPPPSSSSLPMVPWMRYLRLRLRATQQISKPYTIWKSASTRRHWTICSRPRLSSSRLLVIKTRLRPLSMVRKSAKYQLSSVRVPKISKLIMLMT